MGFMKAEITEKRDWAQFEGSHGETFFVPLEYYGGEPENMEVVSGYGARLSAPGYLDCTEWTVFDTEEEAKTYLMETFDLDENLQDLGEEEE